MSGRNTNSVELLPADTCVVGKGAPAGVEKVVAA